MVKQDHPRRRRYLKNFNFFLNFANTVHYLVCPNAESYLFFMSKFGFCVLQYNVLSYYNKMYEENRL